MNQDNTKASSNEEETVTVEQEEQAQSADDGIEVHSVEDDAGIEQDTAQETSEEAKEEKKEEEESKDETQTPKKKKPRARQRIKKLSEENRKLKEELERLKAQSTGDDRGNSEESSTPPDIDDYDSFDEWEKAMTAYEASNATKQDEEPEQKDVDNGIDEKQIIEDYEVLQDIFDETDVREKYKDFDDVVSDGDLFISPTLMHSLTNFDDTAGELLYYLANDPDHLAEISSLEPLEQVRYLGRLEASIEAGKKPKARRSKKVKVSDAPDPIDPIDGGSKGVKSLDDDDLTYEEYEALMNKQRSKKVNDGWL